MDDSYLFTLFEGLDRQGPGSDACTIRMFDLLAPPVPAAILDIGCGAGSQTLALARRCPDCTITAVDIHQPCFNPCSLGWGARSPPNFAYFYLNCVIIVRNSQVAPHHEKHDETAGEYLRVLCSQWDIRGRLPRAFSERRCLLVSHVDPKRESREESSNHSG